MLSHARIWAAIDRLAERNDLTASGLARRAGLDPTTFNRSKRAAADGRPRWPSTESIAKILEATAHRDRRLPRLSTRRRRAYGRRPFRQVPLLGLAQAGAGGFFDDGGFPAGQGWDRSSFPATAGDNVFALEVSGDSMLPLYRDGDTIIVARDAPCRQGRPRRGQDQRRRGDGEDPAAEDARAGRARLAQSRPHEPHDRRRATSTGWRGSSGRASDARGAAIVAGRSSPVLAAASPAAARTGTGDRRRRRSAT